MEPPVPDATELLQRVGEGRHDAEAPLLSLLYGELHGLARRHMRGQSSAHTLQPTALLHEAWVRLVGDAVGPFENRQHFLAFASRAMRNVLVDHARARKAQKRGGDRERVPLDDAVASYEAQGFDVLELEAALTRLAEQEPELVRLVELRFFGGLEMREAAEVLGVSLSTAERRWRMARMWLRSALGGAEGDAG